MSDNGKCTRRVFAGTILGTGVGACAAEPEQPLEAAPAKAHRAPPPGAKTLPTFCDYCIVGCGYEAVVWPKDSEQSDKAESTWHSENMHTVVQIEGRPHNVVVRPDPNAQAVNLGGDHSVRGGVLAQKLYSEERPTRDRLKRPKLRVGGTLVEIEWDDALDIVAGMSRHVIDTYGPEAWGIKHFSYQYYENTYALTKLALGAIRTPAWAVHDKPAAVPDAPGLSDAGFNAFNASYQDWYDSDVIVVSGVSLYDAKSVLFTQWVQRGGARLVVINPRRDLTAAYAEQNGGLHLQLTPGTDTVLYNAIARVILVNGWEDSTFINDRVARSSDLSEESGFRRQQLGMDFASYRAFIVGDLNHQLDRAEEITGVPKAQITAAARLMVEDDDGQRPKTSFMLEKGNYWSHNVDNTASYVSLGLIVGAGGGPGQVIARAGGHQRGMLKAARYPIERSPDSFEGTPLPLNVDRHVLEGHVRFMWVVGTTWFAAMAASQALAREVRRLARQSAPQTEVDAIKADGRVDVPRVLENMRERAAHGGMVLVQQEIYENELSEYADLVLPAATWGEADFTRMQGERRLRIASKIMDPPGEARPDWQIVQGVAQRMAYSGFDWADGNAVFEEAAHKSVGTAHDYLALVEAAQETGVRAHDYLRALGTTGVQCPVRVGPAGELQGTTRLHDNSFNTASGKAILLKGSWSRASRIQASLAPGPDELWVINNRVNALWQSLADDRRIPFRLKRFPAPFVEINAADAASRGIENGDWVELANDRVPDQLGIPHSVRVEAIAYVSDAVLPGVACSYFNYGGKLRNAVNGLTSGIVDPMNPVYRYKLGRARLRRIGRSEYADEMCFLPLNIV